MRNRVELLVRKIFNKAAGDEPVVLCDPNFEKEIRFYSKFFNKTHGVSNATTPDVPVLNIPDYDLFVGTLTNYIVEALSFHKNDHPGLDSRFLCEKLIYDLFGNATMTDFSNIIPFIQKRTRLLQNKFEEGVFTLGSFKEFKILGAIGSNYSNMEAPYKFLAAFDDEFGNRFKLPAITFGVDGDTVYVCAIQNTAPDQKNQAQNKLDRFFRKVNLNVDENDEISKISPNFLVVFTIFASYMRQIGKKEIIAPFYFPVRYDANQKHHMDYISSTPELENYLEKHDRDYYNAVNRFAYLFLRYNHHFDNCTAEYDELNSQIITKLEKSHPKDKNIIYDIDGSVCVPYHNGKQKQ